MFKDDEDSSARVDRYKKFEAMNAYEILLAEKIKTYDVTPCQIILALTSSLRLENEMQRRYWRRIPGMVRSTFVIEKRTKYSISTSSIKDRFGYNQTAT